MLFPRGGEQHCWLVLVSMKAIGLRASAMKAIGLRSSAAFDKAMGGGNDGEWIC